VQILLGCWVLFLFLAIAAFYAIKALRARRRGELYRFYWYDGGLLMMGREVRPEIVLGLSAVYVLVGLGLAAWGAGVPTLLRDAESGCSELLTDGEVSRFAGDFDHEDQQDLDSMCRWSFATVNPQYVRFEVEIDAAYRSQDNVDYRIEQLGGDVSQLRAPSGAPVTRVDRERETVLFFREGQAGAQVTLPRSRVDESEITQIIALVDSRRAVMAPYGEPTGPSELGLAIRRNLIWICGALVVIGVVGSFVVMQIRRRRAMRKIMEEID
jgi:hypothetical protein